MSSSIQYLDHLKIPLEDIRVATNNFSSENFIRQGGFGKIYKGTLLRSGEMIDIVARRLDGKYGQGSKEFLTEVSMLSNLQHENLVCLVGFCDEKNMKIVVNKYEAKGSLDNYITDPSLTWPERLNICVGVAHALSYIHYYEKRDFSVIHRNVKSSKILLDDYLKPKLSGFELSLTTVASQRDRLCIEDACGSTGYVDPAYVKTGSVAHKSDIYSFGVLLFEVLFGKKAITDNKDIKLAQLAKSHYEQPDDLINPDLRKQMNGESLKIFLEAAYGCLNEDRAERPDILQVVEKLEKAFAFQQTHGYIANFFEGIPGLMQALNEPALEMISSDQWEGQNLEHLYAGLYVAADCFSGNALIQVSENYCLHKSKQHIFDRKYSMVLKADNNSDLQMQLSTVIIQRFSSLNKSAEMFLKDILALIKYKHRNIVPFLGYISAQCEMLLVYDYPSNGILADHLKSTSNINNFSWEKRIKICIDIAEGLNYIQTCLEYNENNLQRTISSENILLKENGEAVIGVFSEFEQPDLILDYPAGSYMHTYSSLTDRKEIDIFHFGIALFEILCWRLVDDPFYRRNNEKGLISFVRRCFEDGTPNEILDLMLMGEAKTKIFRKGIARSSFVTFSEIAYRCLGGNHIQHRPTIKLVLKELKRALYLQEVQGDKLNLQISLADVKLATQDFSHKNLIGEGGFGKVYRGNLTCAGGHKIIAAKRLDRKSDQGKTELMTELTILSEYKHMNVIDLVSYCSEEGEEIILYEYASRGCLEGWLKHEELTWRKRLEICVDIARGLDFLHGTNDVKQDVVIHRDIKSANILLHGDWKASIADFGLSLISPINQDLNYVIDHAKGTPGYCDPLYITNGVLTKESDIYSFGVLLFEMLCGRFVIENKNSKGQDLVCLVRHHYKEGTLNEMVFEATKKQMVPKSLIAFQKIAYQCIREEREKRPTASDVLIQLKKTLEFQEDIEIWKPKLLRDYKRLIQMTDTPEICYGMNNKDLYTWLHKRFLHREHKVFFSLGTNGGRVETISATEFQFKSYYRPNKWRTLSKSRFGEVVQISDSSEMNIQISVKTQLLSPGVNYGVYLVYKFCPPRPPVIAFDKSTRTHSLIIIMRGKVLYQECTTRRDDDGWMRIELYRFSNLKEEAYFDALLKGFPGSFKNVAIYVEGVEFRPID